ncbi:MAG TPA: carbohydrate ABC transporter permease [Clostridia bacterium]|nr:carbohydrate ABC transporter permease [Clostridia bacterium]
MRRIVLIIMIITALLYVFPIVYTFTNSFMAESQVKTQYVQLIPEEFNLQQYYTISLYKGEYFKFFATSVKLTVIVIAGQLAIGLLAAFAFAKMKFRGSELLFGIYVLAVLLPFQVTLVPNYLLFDKVDGLLGIKLLDTHWAIMLPGIFSSFGVFLLRQFIRGIPNEVIESARMDGAGYFKILFRIILPIVKPAVYALVILTFIDNWNLIEQAVIFLDTQAKLPLSVFLENIYYEDYGVFYAGAVLYVVPALIIMQKGERYLREGLAMGGLSNDK